MDDYTPILTPEERTARRAQRAAARRRKQRLRRRRMLLRALPAGALGLVLVVTLTVWGQGQSADGLEAHAADSASLQTEVLRKAAPPEVETLFHPGMSDEEKLDIAAARVFKRWRGAFEELAK